GRSAFWDQWH
ncbi:acrB/AcrD/AcrF family protein, partial [Vibrio parahaemolyticus V-223/04]